MERILAIPFRGKDPVQVRSGKSGTPVDTWPAGWRWSPGRVMTPRPDLIPDIEVARRWNWETGSIEEMYQKAKVIQVLEN